MNDIAYDESVGVVGFGNESVKRGKVPDIEWKVIARPQECPKIWRTLTMESHGCDFDLLRKRILIMM
jgi:hypothetical protein